MWNLDEIFKFCFHSKSGDSEILFGSSIFFKYVEVGFQSLGFCAVFFWQEWLCRNLFICDD